MSELDDPRISALYRKASNNEPESSTDDAILDAARSAVRRHRRNYIPWATAATVLLGVGLAWQVLLLPPEQFDQAERPQPSVLPAEPVEPSSTFKAAKPAQESRARAQSEAPVGSFLDIQPQGFAKRREAPPAALVPAPAAALSQGVHIEADGETSSDCEGLLPEEAVGKNEWRDLIAEARKDGEAERLRCLQLGYEQQFGEPSTILSTPTPGE